MAGSGGKTAQPRDDYANTQGGNRPRQGPGAGTAQKDRYYDAADQAHPAPSKAHADVRTTAVPFSRRTFRDDNSQTLMGTSGDNDGDWDDGGNSTPPHSKAGIASVRTV